MGTIEDNKYKTGHNTGMPKKLVLALREDVYTTMVTKPAWSDRKIANHFNISKTFVLNLRHKFVKTLDYTLARDVASAFLAEFQLSSDYFKLQITKLDLEKEDLERLKSEGRKVIYKKNPETDATYAQEVPLDAMDRIQISRDIRSIEKQQTDLWKDILILCRQGQAVQVMKLVQSGRIIPVSS